MDGHRFDHLARSFAGGRTRRGFLGGLVAIAAGVVGAGPAAAVACPAGQYAGSSSRCLCKATARPPVGGTCPCGAGQTSCAGACTSFNHDVANCGACGHVCPVPANAVAACTGGTCHFVCNAGYRACGDICIPDVPGSCCDVGECPAPAAETCQEAATCVDHLCGFSPSPAGTVCRTAPDVCAQNATCTGASLVCPANQPKAAGTVCRGPGTICELDAKCNGSSFACPANPFAPSTTVCRPSTGPCDPEERCTGGSSTCPTDARTPNGEQGQCPPNFHCQDGQCACTPKTCADFPNGCGQIDNGCNDTITCITDCNRGNQFTNQVCINNVCSCAGGAVPCNAGCYCVDLTDSENDRCVFSEFTFPSLTCDSNDDCEAGNYCGSSLHSVGNICRQLRISC